MYCLFPCKGLENVTLQLWHFLLILSWWRGGTDSFLFPAPVWVSIHISTWAPCTSALSATFSDLGSMATSVSQLPMRHPHIPQALFLKVFLSIKLLLDTLWLYFLFHGIIAFSVVFPPQCKGSKGDPGESKPWLQWNNWGETLQGNQADISFPLPLFQGFSHERGPSGQLFNIKWMYCLPAIVLTLRGNNHPRYRQTSTKKGRPRVKATHR